MSDIQQEADEITEILNTYCRQEALGRDGELINLIQCSRAEACCLGF
jgi:hypothetical protein